MRRLSNREKQEFYSGLARLIRSGGSLPHALDLLSRDAPGGLRDFLRSLNERVKSGEPIGDALLRQRPSVTELEASIVTAANRSGRLDRGCDQLARYFEALAKARSQIVGKMIYPLVMLHLTIFTLQITVLTGQGLGPYLWATLRPLSTFYAFAAGLWICWQALAESARRNAVVDRLIRRIPGVGVIRERFALARFFATLEAQLEAQVNLWDAFANAARTSDSGRMLAAARRALSLLQAGGQLSDAMSATKMIPEEYLRAIRIAEETGELHAELASLAQRSEELAMAALARWSEWLPKIIYIGMLLYAAWQIVKFYSDYMSSLNNFDPFKQ